MAANKVLALLRDCEIFTSLTNQELAELARFCELVTFDDQRVLFQRGSIMDQVFVVASGSVGLVGTPQGIGAEEPWIAIEILPTYRVIGWATVLGMYSRSVTAKAFGKTECLRISGEHLRSFMEANPRAGFHLMRGVSVMMRSRLLKMYGMFDDLLGGPGARTQSSVASKFVVHIRQELASLDLGY